MSAVWLIMGACIIGYQTNWAIGLAVFLVASAIVMDIQD